MKIAKVSRTCLPLAVTLLLAGCAVFNVTAPAGSSTVSSPVTVNIGWGESLQSNTFKVVLDSNTDVTSQFTVTASGSGATATGSLTISPGGHTLLVSGNLWTWYEQNYEFTSTTVNFTVSQPAFGISLSPNPLAVPVNGKSTLTVNVTAGSGITTANVTVGALPNQVSASPNPFSVTIASGTGSGSTVVAATSSASPGHSTVTITGTGSGQTATSNLTLNIGSAPTISSVSPAMQPRGGLVTISGANFDINCANDKVTIGGVSATPNSPCSATSLKVQVPQQASFEPNPGQVTVATGAGTSNGVSFVVSRQAGAFTEITTSIEGQISNQTCSTGAVQLQVCSSNCGSNYPYVATYKKAGGAQIGQPIPFYKDNSRVSGLGGAGFSLCTIGVVLDGDTTGVSPQLMGIGFLDLVSGTPFPSGGSYYFNYVTPAGTASYVPRIFRSPDGTMLILASASTIGPSALTAAVFDQANPSTTNASCQSASVSSSFSASITASNQVSISLAGTACTVPIH